MSAPTQQLISPQRLTKGMTKNRNVSKAVIATLCRRNAAWRLDAANDVICITTTASSSTVSTAWHAVVVSRNVSRLRVWEVPP